MDIRGLAERTESCFINIQFYKLNTSFATISPAQRGFDEANHVSVPYSSVRETNSKKKKKFFSAATPLAARPPFSPENTRPSIAYLPDRILPKIHATKNKIYFFINFIL
jgi:hypothetical protein